MKTQVRNSKNQLTAYGLSCGYVEKRIDMRGIELEMYKEHSIFNVRLHNTNTYELNKVWDCFDSLSAAKARFNDLCQKHDFVKFY